MMEVTVDITNIKIVRIFSKVMCLLSIYLYRMEFNSLGLIASTTYSCYCSSAPSIPLCSDASLSSWIYRILFPCNRFVLISFA